MIHAVDAEGKTAGIEEDLAALLGEWQGIPVTYAGGVGTWEIWPFWSAWAEGRSM